MPMKAKTPLPNVTGPVRDPYCNLTVVDHPKIIDGEAKEIQKAPALPKKPKSD